MLENLRIIERKQAIKDERKRLGKTQQDALRGYLVPLQKNQQEDSIIWLHRAREHQCIFFFFYGMMYFKVLPTNSMQGAEHIAGSGIHEQASILRLWKIIISSSLLPVHALTGSNNKFLTTWINERPTLSTRADDAVLHLSLFKRSATRDTLGTCCHVVVTII